MCACVCLSHSLGEHKNNVCFFQSLALISTCMHDAVYYANTSLLLNPTIYMFFFFFLLFSLINRKEGDAFWVALAKGLAKISFVGMLDKYKHCLC